MAVLCFVADRFLRKYDIELDRYLEIHQLTQLGIVPESHSLDAARSHLYPAHNQDD